MGKNSGIAWTDHTWNPWVGCTKVSKGCENCYMFRDQKRWGNDPTEIRRTADKTFMAPSNWQPGYVFVCSWSDFFHEDVPEEWRKDAMQLMNDYPHHCYLLLTKRPENVLNIIHSSWWEENPHVWLGVTAENQEMADLRIPLLLSVPASVRFVSVEPMIGPVEFDERHILENGGVQWVIVGGESGAGGRFMDPNWARSIRYQCAEHGIPFFMKQMTGNTKEKREAIPDDLRYREFPGE